MGLLVFLVSLCIFSLTINGVTSTDHTTSFVQLGYAVLYNHTLALGDVGTFHPDSVDDLAYHGKYYSALAPGTVFLALPFLAVGFAMAGGYSIFGYVLLASGGFMSLVAALATYVVFKLGTLYFRRPTSVFVSAAFAFSTTAWPFAGWLFQSDLSALLVVTSAYFSVLAGRAEAAWKLSALSGIALAVAVTIDYVNLELIPIVSLFLLMSGEGKSLKVRSAVAFAMTSALGPVLVGYYDYLLFGNPFTTTEQVYLGAGTIFSSFSYPILDGLALNLVSPVRGLFLFAPVAILGALGYLVALRLTGLRREILLMIAMLFAILLAYSAWYGPTGGLAFGPRYLVTVIPFAVLPAGFAIEKWGRPADLAAYGLYIAGVAMNGMAAITTAIPSELSWWSSPYLGTILPSFVGGQASAWWWGSAYGYGPVFGVIILFLAGLMPAMLSKNSG